MTRDETETEVGRLLARERALRRFNIDLPPDERLLLQRLLYRLGWTRMSRRTGVKRYTENGPVEPHRSTDQPITPPTAAEPEPEWDGSISDADVTEHDDLHRENVASFTHWTSDGEPLEQSVHVASGDFTPPGRNEPLTVYRWVHHDHEGDQVGEGDWTDDASVATQEGTEHARDSEEDPPEPEDEHIQNPSGQSWGRREHVADYWSGGDQYSVRLEEGTFEFAGQDHECYRWTTRSHSDGDWTLDRRQAIRDGEEYASTEDEGEPESDSIHPYSYKPDYEPLGGKGPHYGAELETQLKDSSRLSLDEAAHQTLSTLNRGLGDEQFAYLKEDSSIERGSPHTGKGTFEIVTQPATLAVHRQQWTPFFASPPSGLISHDANAGLHVHVGREHLSTLGIGKMFYFVNNPANKDFLTKLARRESPRWAAMDPTKKVTDVSRPPGSRYTALNLSPTHTVEFRLFRGTLKPESFFAALEFVDALVNLTRPGMSSVADMETPDKLVQYVTAFHKKYPNLLKFVEGYLGKQLVKRGPRKLSRSVSWTRRNVPLSVRVLLPNRSAPPPSPAQMSRRTSVAKYAAPRRGRQRMGRFTPEQERILSRAMETDDDGAWGALGDHLAENGHAEAGAVLSRCATGHPDSVVTYGPEHADPTLKPGQFRYYYAPFARQTNHVLAGIHSDGRPFYAAYTERPDRMSRRTGKYRYAKADTRHEAHPLIAGFPIEHALRHMANDASRSDNVRTLAKRALTTGDTSALWGLHDATIEDGGGVPGGYNLMSAADKIHLDAHTRVALEAESARSKHGIPSEHHDSHSYSPEAHAERAERALATKRGYRNDHFLRQDREVLNRIRAHVAAAVPGVDPKLIDESIRRHAHRAWSVWSDAHETQGIASRLRRENALKSPDEQGDDPDDDKTIRATRYRRQVQVKFAKVNRSDFIDALRRLKSSNHTALTAAATDVAKRMGVRDTHVLPALHDSPTGSVPGVSQAVYGTVAPEKVHELAAWVNGLLPNSPGYSVFHPRPSGPDTLYRMRHEGSGMDVRTRLDKAGIKQRVMVPHRRGFDVIVPDKGNRLQKNVEEYAQRHGLQLEASPGHFQSVGSGNQAQARDTFRNKVVAGEKVQMSRRNPRRYADGSTNEDGPWLTGADLPETIRQGLANSRRVPPTGRFRHDTTAGGVLADALDEAGEPHAPFFRNLVVEGDPIRGYTDREGNRHNRTHLSDTTNVRDGESEWSLQHTRTPSVVLIHRRPLDAPAHVPTHTAVMDAPALREWAAHPKVGPSLRAALVNAADHLESTTPPKKLSRRRSTTCRS